MIFYFASAIFFFQAEDGIRGDLVTGVQTCALPIWRRRAARRVALGAAAGAARPRGPSALQRRRARGADPAGTSRLADAGVRARDRLGERGEARRLPARAPHSRAAALRRVARRGDLRD